MERIYKIFGILGVILAALVIVAFTREYVPSWKGEQRIAGQTWRAGLFEENCATCHGEEGQGRISGRAPAIGNRDFLALADEEFLVQTVKYGRPGSNMMAYGRQDGGILSDRLIREIVTYFRTMEDHEEGEKGTEPKSTKTTKTKPIVGSPDNGKDLYILYCAECHGLYGQGRVGTMLNSIAFQDLASDNFIKDTITRGRRGTPMGAFGMGLNGVEELTETEINDLVTYIRSLRTEGM